jgi:hypothetical protein
VKILRKGRGGRGAAGAALVREREVGREGEVREGGEEGGPGGFVTLKCNATRSGAARTSAAPLRVAPHTLPRHRHWRRTNFCHATLTGAAKRGYSSEIFSKVVYYLKWFEV